jgi:hypothetical protein
VASVPSERPAHDFLSTLTVAGLTEQHRQFVLALCPSRCHNERPGSKRSSRSWHHHMGKSIQSTCRARQASDEGSAIETRMTGFSIANRLTVGMPYCAAKTRSRPGAIVLIAMVAGVGASGLLSGWITRAGPSLRSHIWERGDRCSRDPVVGTHLCVHSPMRHEHTGNQHVGTDEGSVRPKPFWEEWLEKASLVIRAADGIVAAAV